MPTALFKRGFYAPASLVGRPPTTVRGGGGEGKRILIRVRVREPYGKVFPMAAESGRGSAIHLAGKPALFLWNRLLQFVEVRQKLIPG